MESTIVVAVLTVTGSIVVSAITALGVMKTLKETTIKDTQKSFTAELQSRLGLVTADIATCAKTCEELKRRCGVLEEENYTLNLRLLDLHTENRDLKAQIAGLKQS